MGKLYYMVTNDELEIPVAMGTTIKEVSKDSGLCIRTIINMLKGKHERKQRKYKCMILDIDDNE